MRCDHRLGDMISDELWNSCDSNGEWCRMAIGVVWGDTGRKDGLAEDLFVLYSRNGNRLLTGPSSCP